VSVSNARACISWVDLAVVVYDCAGKRAHESKWCCCLQTVPEAVSCKFWSLLSWQLCWCCGSPVYAGFSRGAWPCMLEAVSETRVMTPCCEHQSLRITCSVSSSSKTISDRVWLLYTCASTSTLCHSRSQHCLILCVSAWDRYHSMKNKASALLLVVTTQCKLSGHYIFLCV